MPKHSQLLHCVWNPQGPTCLPLGAIRSWHPWQSGSHWLRNRTLILNTSCLNSDFSCILLSAKVLKINVSRYHNALFGPRREAGFLRCLHPVWNLRAVIWFHFFLLACYLFSIFSFFDRLSANFTAMYHLKWLHVFHYYIITCNYFLPQTTKDMKSFFMFIVVYI